MPPRRRKPSNGQLQGYPGLGRYTDGRYYFENPSTGRQSSLKTKDLKTAISRWTVAQTLHQKTHGDTLLDELAERLQRNNRHKSKGEHILLADFIKLWRRDILEAGKLRVKIKRNQGKLVSPRTVEDYRAQALQLEDSPDSQFPLSDPDALRRLRRLLAPWVTKPTHYNHLKAVLGRVYDHAVSTGLVDRNPMKDIDKQAVSRREVMIAEDVYLAITQQLITHEYCRKSHDGEWRVRVCDLMYMLSQQPIDVFGIQLNQIDFVANEIVLARHKTKVEGVITMNDDLRETVEWLLNWRKQQLGSGKVVPLHDEQSLLIYPRYMGKRVRFKAVQHRTFSEWWRQAATKAGYPGQYWLMDLRKTGLTKEYLLQGENDKGLHETQAMKDHYRLVKLPKRSINTLTRIKPA